jgi:hypothetical protein
MYPSGYQFLAGDIGKYNDLDSSHKASTIAALAMS